MFFPKLMTIFSDFELYSLGALKSNSTDDLNWDEPLKKRLGFEIQHFTLKPPSKSSLGKLALK